MQAKIGPKEAQRRALRETHAELAIPPKFKRGHPDCVVKAKKPEDAPPIPPEPTPRPGPTITTGPETVHHIKLHGIGTKKMFATPSEPAPVAPVPPPAAEAVIPKAEAQPEAEQQETETMKTKASKKAARAKARKPVTAKTQKPKPATNDKSLGSGARKLSAIADKTATTKVPSVRPGSKLEKIVKLLQRPEGCTTAEVLKACAWPAVSMPQMAKSSGLTLVTEKNGKVTRYWDAATKPKSKATAA